MYTKDIEKGMKVVPVTKSFKGPLSESKEWAKAKGWREYLWVQRVVLKGTHDVEGAERTLVFCTFLEPIEGEIPVAGEFFRPKDLRAYPWEGWECRNEAAATRAERKAARIAKREEKEAKEAEVKAERRAEKQADRAAKQAEADEKERRKKQRQAEKHAHNAEKEQRKEDREAAKIEKEEKKNARKGLFGRW